ncbi:MAG: S8 family serine peptidase [Aquidulcibacter sp.]
MNDPLALLREMVIATDHNTNAIVLGAFPADELRFTLEYDRLPDLSEETARVASLLNDDRFVLVAFAEASELSQFLILRFPGIARTLPSRMLFEIGYKLCDALKLVSAEPDIGSRFFTESPHTDIERKIESAEVIGPLCWVNTPAPSDTYWALKVAKFEQAWQTTRGEGILIAQPDSGIAEHAALSAAMFDLALARNVLAGDNNPTDPLRAGTANPGHGTATASVLASRDTGVICGAAPAAKIVPIRCLEDVKIFDTAPVAAAIAHAVETGCHVISMSLGGIPSAVLHSAVKLAEEKNLIIVAAAGNCVRTVVWPARYDEVIAVAGTNSLDQTWMGSSRGSAVDVAAPAELVWRAERSKQTDPLTQYAPGQGTSFATALVAGAAALWLSAHGRQTVIEVAASRGISVQKLFRAALKASARRPADWGDDFGAGILDAAQLVALPLEKIEIGAQKNAYQLRTESRLLDEEMWTASADDKFLWKRYQAEIATIVISQRSLGAKPAEFVAEAKWVSTQPSPSLRHDANSSTDDRLRCIGQRSGASISRPPLFESAVPSSLPYLSVERGFGLEGRAVQRGLASIKSALARGERLSQLNDLHSFLSNNDSGREIRDTVIAGAEEAISQLGSGRELSAKARLGLEALVKLSGRPALRVRGGTIDINDPRAKDWKGRLTLYLSGGHINDRFSRIGRIDCDDEHVGTGFVIGNGLILTNRHVLQHFAAPIPRRNNPDRWVLTSDNVTIDFAEEPSSLTVESRFKVVGVVGSGPRDIDEMQVDFACTDAAVLAVETTNANKQTLPTPLELDGDVRHIDRRTPLLIVGYPAQPASLPQRRDGSFDTDVTKRLYELFGHDYGTKYLAAGEVMTGLGSHSADNVPHVFGHDATTLVGNSGSAVIGTRGPLQVVGLHFGGHWLGENFAHAIQSLRAASYLSDASVKWSGVI